MSTTTTLSPPSPVMGGGKHNHHTNIISPDAMVDVKSKIEKLANELKQQQKQQRCHNQTCPIPLLPSQKHQLQQQYAHDPSAPGPVSGIPGLEPTSRSLSDLHNERSYLLHNLQTQGERATRLYQRYAHLEAKKEALASLTCASSTSAVVSAAGSPPPLDENKTGSAATATTCSTSTSSKKKKIKKDLSLLRSRIAESTQQEQLIMLRLGEIHVELVNRGRWVMTHQQHQCQQQQMVYSPMPGVVEGGQGQGQGYFGHYQWHQHHGGQVPATPTSAESYSDSPMGEADYLYTPSVLSPLSPSFVPGGGGGVSFFDEDIWTRPSQQEQPQDHLAPETPEPVTEHEKGQEQHQEQGVEAEAEEEDDQTPKPNQDHDLEAVPLSAVTPKFNTAVSTISTTTTTLPSEHPATPITPSNRIPWDEYPSDSEDDGSFESFDGSSFTPIGVTAINPLAYTNPSIHGSGSSGSGAIVSEPEEEEQQQQQQQGEGGYNEEAEEEEEEEEAEGSDDSASEPGDLLSEQQRRTVSFSRGESEECKGNRRLSMPSLKTLWPAALAAVGV
ncbi:hypothetical protein QBC32DRAFT_379007 [Pseudoneurospora amorphoporcata]|uniref:Uncharacterized protein n=1 Tax=Pseudoneurospora amorphoporcata TaxID=241081 RepID=A0AAN6SJ11_9PEZI|nr:hypothetical protein QBC32DRAFT_379007 [Pseudoneurospora amorphoporcata]